MSKSQLAAFVGLALTLASASGIAADATPTHAGTCVDSPQAVLTFCVNADARGPWYDVYRKSAAGSTAGDRSVIAHARLGLVLDGFGNVPASRIDDARRNSANNTWEQPWGEQRVITDRHNELRVTLSGADAARTEPYDLVVRVFDEGFGFRYDFKSIAADRDVAVTDELTEFNLVDEYDAWWYPARFPDRDEYLYHRAKLYEVHLAETPLTLQSPGLYLSIHEAALVDFASMNLRRTAERRLKADLMPWSDGVLVRKRGPFTTPWRTVLVAETPAALADSRMELNLNEPNKLGDT
jgi:alpha-glucosidase